MLKLGVIGTSWIARSFIDAAHMTEKFQFSAVYSRRLESADQFFADFKDIQKFDNLDDFFKASLDIIYIASPNALHFEQANAAILAGHNVIVEKPAFSNPKELKEIIKLAKENEVFFFEAARNIHEHSFSIIKDFLADKTVKGADFTYSKYSSKMPALLNGEIPNKFNAKFSGGLLADLGVYLLYAAIFWFGKPRKTTYDAVLLPSGVDLAGVGILDYQDYKVSIKCAGNVNSYLPSEIYTTDGTLILDGVNAITSAKFITMDGSETIIDIEAPKHSLYDEAVDFAQILENNDFAASYDLHQFAQEVSETSYQMRQSAGIVFDADNK
ncbi:oxidoreductase Gfo/Idh/MocA family [Lactococcus lactis subsp. lactis]|uniref:Dehydrogenase n=2 Tax=Lactococcus lactis TaxID=1358 RepID=A0A2A5S911_LACLH|nr:Gfo/Idh/MocA family oxidoreductase [Lactococcus lactis]KAA8701906.1 Gfo/Idh/MocA family oxidoreductase [Lactococcus lactis subsp. hordniae]KSU10118.1 oxidoreductase Gfo/Idh/MocA family [Lactococcus lactis subsp. lactis]MCT3134190.1 gfo/Idh/MocA family oxidoreductase [Lactococcus lactis]PCS09986.1 dehydrogenase [Lactococcus lactis subsp. hordniae]